MYIRGTNIHNFNLTILSLTIMKIKWNVHVFLVVRTICSSFQNYCHISSRWRVSFCFDVTVTKKKSSDKISWLKKYIWISKFYFKCFQRSFCLGKALFCSKIFFFPEFFKRSVENYECFYLFEAQTSFNLIEIL